MKNRFDKSEILLLEKLLNMVNDTDRDNLLNIIAKIKKINADNKTNREATIDRILEKRKEDKWYGRSKSVVQNHFNAVARKIVRYVNSGWLEEARLLYQNMKSEAKFPKYEEQFNIAVDTYLLPDLYDDVLEYLRS